MLSTSAWKHESSFVSRSKDSIALRSCSLLSCASPNASRKLLPRMLQPRARTPYIASIWRRAGTLSGTEPRLCMNVSPKAYCMEYEYGEHGCIHGVCISMTARGHRTYLNQRHRPFSAFSCPDIPTMAAMAGQHHQPLPHSSAWRYAMVNNSWA